MMMKTAVLTFKGGVEYIKEKQVENALDRCNENFALSVSDYDELDYCLPYLAEAGVQNLVVLHENFNLYSFEKALREEYGRYFDNIEVVPELFPRSLREGHPTGNVKAGYYNDQMTQSDVTDVIASKELFYEIYAANAPVWGVESFKPHCTQFVSDEEQINIVPIEDKEDPGIDAAIDNNEAINELALVTNSEPSEIVSMINQGLFAEIVEKLKSANLNSQHYEHFRKIVLYHIMSNYNLKTNGPVMSEGNVQNRLGGTLSIEDQTGNNNNNNGAEDASFQILERRGRRHRYNRIKEGDSTVIRRPLLIAEKVCDGTDQNWFSTGVWYFAIDENDTTVNQFFQKYGNSVFVTDSSVTNSSTVASGNYNYVIYETNVYPLSFGFDVLKDDGALGFVSRNVTVLNCDSLNNFSNVVQSFTSAQYQTFNSAVISGPSPEEKSQINDYLTRNGMDPLYETTLREGDLVPYNNGGSGNNSLSVVNNNSNALAVNNKSNNNALTVTGGNKGLAVYSGGNNNLPAVVSPQQGNNIKDDSVGGVDNKFNQTSKKGSLLSVVSLDPSNGIWSANAYKLNSLKKGVVFNQPNDVSFCRSYASLVRSLRQSNALAEGGTVSIVVPKHMNDALGNAREVEQQYNVRLNIIEKEGEDFTSLKPRMAEAYKLGAQIIKTPKIGSDKTNGLTGDIEGSDRFKSDKRDDKLKMWKNQQVMPFTSFLIKTLSDIKATIELGNDDVAATNRHSLMDILLKTIGAYDDLSTASKNAQNGGAALIIDASKVLIDYFKKDEGTKTSSSDSYIMHKDWDNFAKCFLPDTFKDATYKDTNLIKAGGLYVES